jgi:uncharacterized membrane protein YkgB
MKKQIKRVSLVQNAKVVAAIYLVLSLPLLAIVLIAGSRMNQFGTSLGMLVFMVLVYVGCGFLFTLIGAWVYNLVAGVVGGFEFTTEEITQA